MRLELRKTTYQPSKPSMASRSVENAELTKLTRRPSKQEQGRLHGSRLKSFALVFVSAVLTTLTALRFRFYRWLPPVEAILINQATCFCFTLPLYIYRSGSGNQNQTERRDRSVYSYLILHCVIAITSALCHYQALKRIPPSVTFIIGSVSPFITLILSIIIFAEIITVIKLLALLVTVASVVLTSLAGQSLSVTETSAQFFIGLAFSFGSCLVGSSIFITLKKVSTLNASSVCLVQGAFCSIVSVIIILSGDTFVIPPCGLPGVILLCCGLFGVLNSFSLYFACKFGEPGKVSAMLTAMNIVLSLLWELLVFGGNLYLVQYISAVLAIAGAILNGFDKYITYPKILNEPWILRCH